MPIVTTDSRTYSDIAEAIRGKGVDGTFKPHEMAQAIEGIQGGGADIAEVIVVKARDENGWPTEIDFYGTIVYPHTFGGNVSWASSRRDMINGPMKINWKNRLAEVMGSAWTYSGQTELDFPLCPIAFHDSAFYADETLLTSFNAPGGGTFGKFCFRSRKGLVICSLGSVGFPVLSVCDNTVFDRCPQSGLTVTLYCKGADADDFLAKCRNGATNATIIIKACEDTEYNGISYSAGSVMITSNP